MSEQAYKPVHTATIGARIAFSVCIVTAWTLVLLILVVVFLSGTLRPIQAQSPVGQDLNIALRELYKGMEHNRKVAEVYRSVCFGSRS